MSEMIERVARAIGETYDGYVDPEATPYSWARAESAVRAVFAAMREPTSEMVRYGESAGYQAIGHKLSQIDGREFAAAAYSAMLAAALGDAK